MSQLLDRRAYQGQGHRVVTGFFSGEDVSHGLLSKSTAP